jgi:hypothetical protein
MTIQEIYSTLKEKHLYPDLYEEKVGDEVMLAAHIEWGDWKHDHRYLDNVMGDLGFSVYKVDVTEENGSDCYSALHLYRKNDVNIW